MNNVIYRDIKEQILFLNILKGINLHRLRIVKVIIELQRDNYCQILITLKDVKETTINIYFMKNINFTINNIASS